jgi:hypothetical protein
MNVFFKVEPGYGISGVGWTRGLPSHLYQKPLDLSDSTPKVLPLKISLNGNLYDFGLESPGQIHRFEDLWFLQSVSYKAKDGFTTYVVVSPSTQDIKTLKYDVNIAESVDTNLDFSVSCPPSRILSELASVDKTESRSDNLSAYNTAVCSTLREHAAYDSLSAQNENVSVAVVHENNGPIIGYLEHNKENNDLIVMIIVLLVISIVLYITYDYADKIPGEIDLGFKTKS